MAGPQIESAVLSPFSASYRQVYASIKWTPYVAGIRVKSN